MSEFTDSLTFTHSDDSDTFTPPIGSTLSDTTIEIQTSATASLPAESSSTDTITPSISNSATSPSASITDPVSSSDSSDVPVSSSTSSSSSSLPVGAISSSSGTPGGAIAGAVIGTLALIALLVGGFLLYRRRRRGQPLLPTRASAAGGGGAAVYQERKSPSPSARPAHPHHNFSVGTLDGEVTLDGHQSLHKIGFSTSTRASYGAEKNYYASPPLSTDDHGLSVSAGSTAADTLANASSDFVPAHVPTHVYAHSQYESAQSSVTTIADHTYTAGAEPRRSSSHRRSRHESGNRAPALVAAPRAGERERAPSSPASPASPTTYPPAAGAPRHRTSAGSFGSTSGGRASPGPERSTPSLAGVPLVAAPAPPGVGRQPSARRAPRKKPVPRYSADGAPAVVGTTPAAAAGEMTPVPSTPLTPVGLGMPGADGRPVHYLIPDMPVHQQ